MPQPFPEVWELYQRLGGTKESLAQSMSRIASEVTGDIDRLELWKEWRNIIDGKPPTQINGLDLARILGIL